MPWFKVDDGLAFNPKVVAAGNAAMGLWVRAGSYCANHLTDGRLPRAMLAPLGGRARDAQKLVECGLWEATQDGWEFSHWEEFQPTKAQVEADRKATAERVAAFRAKRRNGVTESVTNGVTNSVGTDPPTRPDPTRPVLPTEVPTESPAKTQRATRLPDSWQPTVEHKQRATDEHVDIDRELVKFRTHAEETGRTTKSWNAAFTRWLMNAAEYARRDGRTPQAQQPARGAGVWDRPVHAQPEETP